MFVGVVALLPLQPTSGSSTEAKDPSAQATTVSEAPPPDDGGAVAASAPPPDPKRARICAQFKAFFKMCFDQSAADTDCAQFKALIREDATNHGSPNADQLAELCETACAARQSNRAWEDLDRDMDCAAIAIQPPPAEQ
jgi:hypothetical protein